MDLISGGASLDTRIKRLVEKHECMSFAVAWASPGTAAFNAIYRGREKISEAVIGKHFDHTHPDVIDAFIGFESCRFILHPLADLSSV